MADTMADRWAFTGAKIAIVVMLVVMVVVIVLNADIAAKGAQQFTNTNMAAPFSALGFLGGAASLLIAVMVVAGAMISGHRSVAKAMALVAAVEVVLYGGMLVAYSRQSTNRGLARGQEKFFCEIDCHLGYTVAAVERDGESLRVSLRTRFDERTIAPWRGNRPLTPSPRIVEVVDAQGRIFDGQQSAGPKLITPLRPGESYTSDFTFRLPPDARDPRLLVRSTGTFPERVLIGNENSFLHGKVYFRL